MDVRPFGTTARYAAKHVAEHVASYVLIGTVLAFNAACSANHHSGTQDKEKSSGLQAPFKALLGSSKESKTAFAITDVDGQPIPNALIMIGSRENVPFPGNVLRTNDKGILATPAEWTDEQPVTIEAAGFVRATYFNASPANANFTLRRSVAFQNIELKGSTSGFGQLRSDGFLDVGLVFPALQRSEVSSLNIANLISPEVDRMSVLGQELSIPSNLTFPDQSESYVLPIRFNKPQYRWYSSEKGDFKFIALHGRLPFRSTVDDLRARKSFFDIINTIDFKQGSFNDVALTQQSQTSNFLVNTTQLSKSLSFTAPQYEAGNIVLAAAIAQDGSRFFPTDLKNVTAGSNVRLAAPQSTGAALILASLRAKNAPTSGPASEFTSSVVLPANSSQAFDFLPSVPAPSLNNEILNLEPPRAPASVEPVMTFAALNKIVLIQNGDIKVERKTPQWDLYSPLWTAQLELPVFPSSEPGTSERMRWEVSFGATSNGETTGQTLGPKAIENLTHITRSALDL